LELLCDLREPLSLGFTTGSEFMKTPLFALKGVATHSLRMGTHQRARCLEVGDLAQTRKPSDALKFATTIQFIGQDWKRHGIDALHRSEHGPQSSVHEIDRRHELGRCLELRWLSQNARHQGHFEFLDHRCFGRSYRPRLIPFDSA
jgi:hypothetical protein